MKVSELTNNGGPTRTPIDTEELKRLAASITPGPWNSSIHGTQVLTGDSWNTICEIRVRKDFSAAQWEDGRGSSDPTANARAIALVPALLRELIELREAEIIRGCCPECQGTGLRDSGGVQPWGEPISVPCDCTPHPAPVTAREEEPTEDELDEAWKDGYRAGFGEAMLTARAEIERLTARAEKAEAALEARDYKKMWEGMHLAATIAGQKSAVLPHHPDIIRGYAQGRSSARDAILAEMEKEGGK